MTVALLILALAIAAWPSLWIAAVSTACKRAGFEITVRDRNGLKRRILLSTWIYVHVYLTSWNWTWKLARQVVFLVRGRQCTEGRAGCDGYATDIHHDRYSFAVLALLDPKPLRPVCRHCHDAIEDAKRARLRILAR